MLNCSSDILTFADKLGVGTYYRSLTADQTNPEELEKFLLSFRNNLELLIQKTWVEKADEDRKAALLESLPEFIALIKKGDCETALEEFEVILTELSWLLFGSQCEKEDFLDYVTRIDDQWGLFWWYSGQLKNSQSGNKRDAGLHKELLFLGLCYLTDF